MSDINVTVDNDVTTITVGEAAAANASALAAAASAAAASASAADALNSENDAAASAASALASENAAALSETNAAASAAAAGVSEAAAAASATDAAGSAATAVAAANASGNVIIYDTKAAANAALSGLSEGQVVEVLVDESRSGQRTRYRKSSGVYVFKMTMPAMSQVYVDSVSGSDSNDGLSPTTPKATLAAAITLAQSLPSPGRLSLMRGSVFHVNSANFNLPYWEITSFGQGLRPIIDFSYNPAVSPYSGGTWVLDGAYTNLWKLDVTVRATGFTTAAANQSTSFNPMLWDEATGQDPRGSRSTRVLRNDTVNGSTVSGSATQADLLTLANATPGSFTIFKQGSANADTVNDLGTVYTFYLNTRDGSDPNSNGRTIYIADPSGGAVFYAGQRISHIVFQRCGAKDMVGVNGGAIKPEYFHYCDFLYCHCHGNVVGGVEFRNCVAENAFPGATKNQGGGFHQYRNDGAGGDGTSRGFKIFNCTAIGFSSAVYSHGSGSGVYEHTGAYIDGFRAYNCGVVIKQGGNLDKIRAKNIFAQDCQAIVSYGDAEIEDSVFINSAPGSSAGVYGPALDTNVCKLTRCFVYGMTILVAPDLTAGVTRPLLHLVDSTVVGVFNDPSAVNNRRKFSLTLENSIVTQFTTNWLDGVITADATSSVEFANLSIEDLIASQPAVNAGVYTGVRRQIFEKAILAGDVTISSAVVGSGRTVAYSGTDNGDGTANLTVSASNDNTYGRYIQVVDAYGSGLHYTGVIRNAGASTSDPMVVAPPPSSAFSGKSFKMHFFNKAIWRDAITATIATDGLSIRVPDATLFQVGNRIRVGHPWKSTGFGIRTVTAVNTTTNVLTLDSACAWKAATDNTGYNPVDGSSSAFHPLPTVQVTFQFPIKKRNVVGDTRPKYLVTYGEGGSATGMQSYVVAYFAENDKIRTRYDLSASGTQVTTYVGLTQQPGYIETGFTVAPGDTLRIECDVYIPEEKISFLVDPVKTLQIIPDPTCLPYLRGAGYKPRFYYALP